MNNETAIEILEKMKPSLNFSKRVAIARAIKALQQADRVILAYENLVCSYASPDYEEGVKEAIEFIEGKS